MTPTTSPEPEPCAGFGWRHPRSAEPGGPGPPIWRHVDAPQPVPRKLPTNEGVGLTNRGTALPPGFRRRGGMSFDGLIRCASRAGSGDQAHPAVPAQPLGLAAVGRRYEVHQAITDCDADQRAHAVPVAAVGSQHRGAP